MTELWKEIHISLSFSIDRCWGSQAGTPFFAPEKEEEGECRVWSSGLGALCDGPSFGSVQASGLRAPPWLGSLPGAGMREEGKGTIRLLGLTLQLPSTGVACHPGVLGVGGDGLGRREHAGHRGAWLPGHPTRHSPCANRIHTQNGHALTHQTGGPPPTLPTLHPVS